MTRREVLHSDGLPSVHMAFTDAAVGSLRVPEVAVKRTWELVDSFFSEAGRVAKSVRTRVDAAVG